MSDPVPSPTFTEKYPPIDTAALATNITDVYNYLVQLDQDNFAKATAMANLELGDYDAQNPEAVATFTANGAAITQTRARIDSDYWVLKTAFDSVFRIRNSLP